MFFLPIARNSQPAPSSPLISKAMRSIDRAYAIAQSMNRSLPDELLRLHSWGMVGIVKPCSTADHAGAGCRAITPARKFVTVTLAGGLP